MTNKAYIIQEAVSLFATEKHTKLSMILKRNPFKPSEVEDAQRDVDTIDEAQSLFKRLGALVSILHIAEAGKCKCDGFTYQYEGGCICGHEQALNDAQTNVINLVKEMYK